MKDGGDGDDGERREFSHLHLESPRHGESDLHRVRNQVTRSFVGSFGEFLLGGRTEGVEMLRGVGERLNGGDVGLSEFGSSEVVGEFLGGSWDGSSVDSFSEESCGGIGDGHEEIRGRLSILRSEKAKRQR